jgi:tetratricopeptide (TPR) repeat protein/tRNA A-37 threonylcarbamoyl transferase component Bud32
MFSQVMGEETQGTTATPLPEDASGSTSAYVYTAAPQHAMAARVLESIGHYRILRLIAQGGMGAVYKAQQERPHRIVALKVIKPGYANEEMTRRFELESQALGRLHHPGIAQIYEAGSAETPFGVQPFFAMEFIEGVSLVAYADEHALDARARLRLLASICDAVHHAHQRGLIHRDLKPSNVIVDASGQPKILDFGIARITDSDSQATQETNVGQLVGTLPYMSPEQVMADPFEIDIRCDVYALGVILYELLVGELPFDLSRKAIHQAVQIIREQEPTRLSSLNRFYRGDIETIVAKTLEKQKSRRYDSAANLAADIRRFLNDEPITARPPSTAYQLQKFARRHRALVIGVAAVFVVLIAGIVASSIESVRARRAEVNARQAESTERTERDRAVRAEKNANEERDLAVTADRAATEARDRAVKAETQAKQERDAAVLEKRRADTETATTKAINDFLTTDLLAQASAIGQGPNAKADPDIKVRTVLDRAAGHIAGRFDGRPQVEGSIESTIGTTYWHLGIYPQAKQHLARALELDRAALGRSDPVTLSVGTTLGEAYRSAGNYAEAEALLSDIYQTSLRSRGSDDPQTLNADRALAGVYVVESKFAKAEPMLSDLLERSRRVLGPDSDNTLDATDVLARVYFMRSKLPDAERLLKDMISIQTRVFGPEHPFTVETMNNLAVLYQREHRNEDAEKLYTKVIEIERRVDGPTHPETLNALNNLAVLYSVEGKYSEAAPIYANVLEQWRQQLGPEHPRTLAVMSNIAVLHEGQHDYAGAATLARRVLEIRTRVLGAEHSDTLESQSILASILEQEGKYAEADPLFTQLVEVRRRVLGPKNPDTLGAVEHLGELRVDQARYAEAEAMLRGCLDIQKQTMPSGYRRYLTQTLLGASLAGEHKYEEAEPLLVGGYEGMKQNAASVSDVDRQKLPKAGELVVRFYAAWNKPQKADEWRQILIKDAAAKAYNQASLPLH